MLAMMQFMGISLCKIIFLLSIIAVQFTMAQTSLTLHGVTDELDANNAKYADALRIAGEAFKEAESLFNDPDWVTKKGWKKETSNDDGDVVYGKKNDRGKMVGITTELPADVETAMVETWSGFEALPSWNKNINFASTIAAPTKNFDLIHYGNNNVLVVSGRDFVSARIFRKIADGDYIMASRSVELSEFPEKDGKVRAELLLGACRFRRHPEDSKKTITDVVMQADLRGMLPKMITNQIFGKIMLMDTETNKVHFTDVMAEKYSNKSGSEDEDEDKD